MTKLEEFLLNELKAARRAIRAIKRETGEYDAARDLCIKSDKRLTAVIVKTDAMEKARVSS